MDFKESDLYSPVCNYFTSLGYDVQAEVKSCDLIAKKDSEIIDMVGALFGIESHKIKVTKMD